MAHPGKVPGPNYPPPPLPETLQGDPSIIDINGVPVLSAKGVLERMESQLRIINQLGRATGAFLGIAIAGCLLAIVALFT